MARLVFPTHQSEHEPEFWIGPTLLDQWASSSLIAGPGMRTFRLWTTQSQLFIEYSPCSTIIPIASRHKPTSNTMHNLSSQSKPMPNTRSRSHTCMDCPNRTPPAEGGSNTHRMLLDQSRCPDPLLDVPGVSTAFFSTGLRWTPYPPIVPPPRPPPLIGFGLDSVPSGFSPAAFSSGVNHPSAGFQSGLPLGSTQTHNTDRFDHTHQFDHGDQFDCLDGFDITTPSTYANHFDNTTQSNNTNQFYSTNLNNLTNSNATMNPNNTVLSPAEISQQSVQNDSSSDIQVLSGGPIVTPSQSNANHVLVDESSNSEKIPEFEDDELEYLDDELEYLDEDLDLQDDPVILAEPPAPAIKVDTRTFEITMNVWQLKPAEPETPINPKA